MTYVAPTTMFSAAVALLPHVSETPLGDLNEEQMKMTVGRAAQLARLLASEFSQGSWSPTIAAMPTVADVHNLPVSANEKPEWIRLPAKGRCPHSGLSRSVLYTLIAPCEANDHRPPVKSAHIRKRGAERGIRLISYDSLMTYLSTQAKLSDKDGGTETAP